MVRCGVRLFGTLARFGEVQRRAFVTMHPEVAQPNFDTVDRLQKELREGVRKALAESITLVESRHVGKRATGDALLARLLTQARLDFQKRGANSIVFRIGISGSPGVGKSTFIEALGRQLIQQHHRRLAVLTVDPSSVTTGGSLLGDVTRMTELSRDPQAYIRSSPARGSLGGVTRGSQEAIILCEAAGFDLVLVETVGVGQSELAVAEMVDMFVLLVSPTHGDELQGIKRGVMEQTDLVLVTKADGDLLPQSRQTQADHISALQFFRPRHKSWRPVALSCSSRTGQGLPEVWETMKAFWTAMIESGELVKVREEQKKKWMWRHVEDELMRRLKRHPAVVKALPMLDADVAHGHITPGVAAETLLTIFISQIKKEDTQ